jgi:delta24-sterol reductase
MAKVSNKAPFSHHIHSVLSAVFRIVWFIALPVRFVIGINLSILSFLGQLFQKSPLYGPFVEFSTNNQTIFVLLVALPISFVWDTYVKIRNYYVQVFLAAPLLHQERVEHVQDQVKAWNAKNRPNLMCTARPPWQTMSLRTATFKDNCTPIDVDLHDILYINEENQTVCVEPMVSMGQLSRYLLPLGYQLAVSVEMDDLTVGGLINGVGIQTNSHIHGCLTDTVSTYEIVLSDGSVVKATREENTDLYYGIPWSHGTLGFLVSVELKIIPCKPYMHLKYIPVYSAAELQAKMEVFTQEKNPNQFVEVTIYSKETSVIMVGNFADLPADLGNAKYNPTGYFWRPWFYKHVEAYLTNGEGEEYMPLRHYIHRHTRSMFWELGDLIPFGNHPIYRYLFGWLGAPKVSIVKLFTNTPEIRRKTVYSHVIQDIMIPITEMKAGIELFDEQFAVYPLLVYPVRMFERPKEYKGLTFPLPNPSDETNPPSQMYFDLGAYGVPPAVRQGKPWDARKSIRALEQFTRDVKGYQMLYADIFMDRDEFELMFDHEGYRELRHKYKAVGAFPEVWDKVKPQYSR